MERFRQKQMKLDELTQPEWEDAADDFCEQDKTYGIYELSVPEVVQPQMNHDAPAPPPTSFGESMESLDIVPDYLKGHKGLLDPQVVISG